MSRTTTEKIIYIKKKLKNNNLLDQKSLKNRVPLTVFTPTGALKTQSIEFKRYKLRTLKPRMV